MAETLRPYEVCDLYEKDDPRFTFAIEDIRRHYASTLQYLQMFSFERERILIHHGGGQHILYGDHLDALGARCNDIGTYRVFDPARHLPVTDASAPIIRRHEIKDKLVGRLGDAFTAPHLRLLDD